MMPTIWQVKKGTPMAQGFMGHSIVTCLIATVFLLLKMTRAFDLLDPKIHFLKQQFSYQLNCYSVAPLIEHLPS